MTALHHPTALEILLFGPGGELRDMVESLLAPFAVSIRRTDRVDEAVAIAKSANLLRLCILLPERPELLSELTLAMREVSPATRLMALDRYIQAAHPEASGEFEAGGLRLDPGELSEFVESSLRLSGGAAGDVGSPLDDRLQLAIQIILTMSTEIERFSYVNGGNSRAIMDDSVRIGRELGLSPSMLDQIALSSLLQDLGMLRVGATRKGQAGDVESHVQRSLYIAETMQLPWNVKPIVMAHHERYDGLGYPRGLSGRAIPVGARILSVVTAFYAMLAAAPGRQPITKREAIEELTRLAGSQFDPEIVELFLFTVHERAYSTESERRVALVTVDDFTRGTLSLRFLRSSYEVSFLESDRSSVETVRRAPPNAIVVGVDTGAQAGLEFMHWLSQDADLDRMPMIALVDADEPDTNRSLASEMGATDVLVKPVVPRDLVTRVGALIRKSRIGADRPDFSWHAGEALRGKLVPRQLPEVLEILRSGRKTAEIRVNADDLSGSVFVEGGRLVHATTGQLEGDEALARIARCQVGSYTILHGSAAAKRTITHGLRALLAEAGSTA